MDERHVVDELGCHFYAGLMTFIYTLKCRLQETISPNKIPPDFTKRLSKKFESQAFRFFMRDEYAPINKHLHYYYIVYVFNISVWPRFEAQTTNLI